MKIYLSYHIGETSFVEEFESFREIDYWFDKYRIISKFDGFDAFHVEVKEEDLKGEK